MPGPRQASSVLDGPDPGRAGTDERPPSGYEQFAPLFAELGRLPAGHPRRPRIRAELITGHLPVARNIARRHAFRGGGVDDLEQVATVGLILAVDRFEPGRGVDFLSFAVPTVTGEVLRHFRDRAGTIRVPRSARALLGSLYEATAELSQQLGRAPRPSELADALGVDRESVLQALQAQHAAHPHSLDEPATGGRDEGQRYADTLGRIDPELEMVELRTSVGPLLAALPDRERRILLLRFFGGMTQTQIAQSVGISQMHVSRVLATTLARLRRRLTADPGPAPAERA